MATTLNRILKQHHSLVRPCRNQLQGLLGFAHGENPRPLPPQLPALRSSIRPFLDFYQFGNRKKIEEERARLNDEMNRGYFADMKEFKDHGGKIAEANKTLIPAMAAMKFPVLAATCSNGIALKLPVTSNSTEAIAESAVVPKVSLVCLSFRASSQEMISSWSKPFLESFKDSKGVQLYEISFIDQWVLCLAPIKRLLLRVMRKSGNSKNTAALQRQIAYSFGDHYYFRKQLKILNLLTGYIFLLDKSGRIRWQGFGRATPEEVSSLLSSASLLLQDQ